MNLESPILHTQAKHGSFYHLATDNVIGACLSAYGEWAEGEVHLFEKLIKPGQVVLEIGANIGTHTVPLSKITGPAGLVYAYEPIPYNYLMLAANILNNGCYNTQTYQIAVGEAQGFIEFPKLTPLSSNNFGAIGRFSSSAETFTCPLLPIDGFKLPTLDFLKIDVEGGEREVILGAAETINRCRPTIFVESFNHHAGTLAPDGHTGWLLEKFKPLGYQLWHFVTPIFNHTNWRGNPVDNFESQWSFDIICMPQERGFITGLPDGETGDMFNGDVNLWRQLEVTHF